MLSDLTQAFVPVGETPPLTGREAESPVALWRDSPLVAAVTKSQSSHEIIIADYQSGRVIARVAQPDPPMRMVCSPSGQQLFVSGEQSCRLYRAPWDKPASRNWDLPGILDAAWQDEGTVLAAGLSQAESGTAWIGRLDVESAGLVLVRAGIFGNEDGDLQCMGACCSEGGRVAFLCGDLYKTRVRTVSLTSAGLTRTAGFQARGDVYRARAALLDRGETVVYCNSRAYLFGGDGALLDEMEGPSGAAFSDYPQLFSASGFFLLNVMRMISGGKRVWNVRLYRTRGGKFQMVVGDDFETPPEALAMDGAECRLAFPVGDRIEVRRANDRDVAQLADPDPAEATRAAERLGGRRHTAARKALEAVIAERISEEEEPLRAAAVGALAAIGEPAALGALIRHLGRRRPLVDRRKLTDAIESFAVGERQAAALRALETDSIAHCGAIRVLERTPAPEALEPLCGALSDADDDIRISAANALAGLADPRAAVALLARLNEANDLVRQAVWTALLATLKAAGLLSDRFLQSAGRPVDLVTFAREVIENGNVSDGTRSQQGTPAELLEALAAAVAGSGLPLDKLFNAIDSLTAASSGFSRRTQFAVGLAVAFALADAFRARKRFEAAEAIYRRAVSLAAEADAPQIAWRCWSQIGACLEESGDLRGASAAYDRAKDFIDRLWFGLLDETQLRGFFRDKAELYERAALCELRLGHAGLALETIEKAKTRYLGDLIARRRLSPHRGIEKETGGFWEAVELEKPQRLPIVETRLGAGERVALADVKIEPEGDSSTRILPEKLMAFEEQSPAASRERDYLRGAWQAAAWSRSLEDRDTRSEALEPLVRIYETLAAVRAALTRGEWPVTAERQEEYRSSYRNAAATASRIEGEGLWVFRELQHLVENLFGPSAGEDAARFLDAILEALGFALNREPVFAISVRSSAEVAAGPLGNIRFLAQALEPRAGAETERSRAVDRALGFRATGRWRYITRLARGSIAGLRQTLDELTDPRSAQVQFAVTRQGTAVFIAYGDSRVAAETGTAMPPLADGRFETLFLPEVTSGVLAGRMAEGPESWFGRYRLAGGSNDLRGWGATVENTLAWLSEALWAPIDGRLQARGVRRLRLIPHRALHLVPFAAMWRHRRFGGPERLVDAYAISYAPSLTLAGICRERAGRGRASEQALTLVADPEGSLPFAQAEGEQVAALFDPARSLKLEGAVATCENVAKAPVAKVFHYTGHGAYDWDDPLNSRLRLADGPLTLAQLFGDSLSLEGTRLAVLSGCETSVTDPADLADEWLGLSAGFLFAGARQTLSTLWAVDDLSSGMLLSVFYRKLLREGRPAACALQEAQRWLRDKADRAAARRFAGQAIAALKAQLASRPRGGEEARRLEGRLEWLEARRRNLDRWPPKPFREPVFWAAFTLSGAFDGETGGDA